MTQLNRLQASLADRYRIERELGRGGMATVFLVPGRFLREIRLCARLQHPRILAVHDFGDAGGQLWFTTMPYRDLSAAATK